MSKYQTELHQILKRGSFSPTTLKKYTNVLDAFIEFAGTTPANWNRITAQNFYSALLSKMQVNSANTYMSSLRYISKWYATLHNRMDFDFAVIQLTEPTGKERDDGKRHALSPEQATEILLACKRLTPLDRRDLAIIVVGLETGMRRKSLHGLWIERIGEPNGYPAVDVPIKGRRGDARYEVPLSDLSLEVIDAWMKYLAEHKIKRGPLFRVLHPHLDRKQKRVLIPGDHGISQQMIYRVIQERAEESGLKLHVHPHLLRHTFVTWRTEAKLTDIEIASITGHAPTGDVSGLKVYRDLARIGGTVRNSTPAWLGKLVGNILRGNT